LVSGLRSHRDAADAAALSGGRRRRRRRPDLAPLELSRRGAPETLSYGRGL
jgi:hypothetical protein